LTLTHLGLAELTAKPTGATNDRLRNYCNNSSGHCDLCYQSLDSYKDLRSI
jgi:hypothetical protein